MAIEWIKNHTERDDPKIARIALLTGYSVAEIFTAIVGGWWFYVDKNFASEDTGATLEEIDLVAIKLPKKRGKMSVAEAMTDKNVDWLRVEDGTVRIQRYEKHFSASAKRRAADQRRKAESRNADKCPDERGQVSASLRTNRGQKQEPEKDSCSLLPLGESEGGGVGPGDPVYDALRKAPWRITPPTAERLCREHPAEAIRHAISLAKDRPGAKGGLLVRLLDDGDAARDLAESQAKAAKSKRVEHARSVWTSWPAQTQREWLDAYPDGAPSDPARSPKFLAWFAGQLEEHGAANVRAGGA